MKFQITPEAKQLILNRSCQITVSIEKEESYACSGGLCTRPYLSVQLGGPTDPQVDEYELLSWDDIKIYVHNVFHKFDTTVTLTIDLDDSLIESLVIYGVVSES